MGVRMTAEEVAEFLAAADVGILSTLRRDGSPIGLPMWFVVVDGDVCFRTRGTGRKVERIDRDARVSFVVDTGAAWRELASVVVNGRAERADPALAARIEAALTEKYAGRGVPEAAPQRTRQHYDVPTVHYRIVPASPPLTWDNSKLLR
jgi:nitroimidazol reductase NimA-like FMN-containing flavoprotein (pyridoxamine 5'-phosphate oxidase superfamily)